MKGSIGQYFAVIFRFFFEELLIFFFSIEEVYVFFQSFMIYLLLLLFKIKMHFKTRKGIEVEGLVYSLSSYLSKFANNFQLKAIIFIYLTIFGHILLCHNTGPKITASKVHFGRIFSGISRISSQHSLFSCLVGSWAE